MGEREVDELEQEDEDVVDDQSLHNRLEGVSKHARTMGQRCGWALDPGWSRISEGIQWL